MWPDKIVEIQPVGTSGGTVVWEWHAWDHLCQNLYPTKDNYVTSIVAHPELLNINYQTQKDWLHVNSLDYNEELDQITFSSHYLNEIYVIDHSTTTAEAASHSGGNSGKGGDILYRWGNPAAYQASGAANFDVVHDAHWIPQDCPRANYLVGFNNNGGTNGKTCVDVFNPPYNGYNYSGTANTAYGPSTYAWRHTYSGSASNNEGNSQQLPNGNTLVNISMSGYMYEIDSNQNVVWSKSVSGTNTSAFRYSSCYVNGGPVVSASANPSQVCQGSSSQLTATVTSGTATSYSWTSVPAGFTSSAQNPVVNPTVTTTYNVTVSNGSCTSTSSVVVTVSSPLTVTATATPSSICPGQSSQLNAQVSTTGSCTYAWSSVPAGFSSALQNPIVNPTVTTTYYVTATEGNCSATNSITVTVTNSLTVAATATPAAICPGQSSLLNAQANSTATCTYSWTSDPPGFTSSVQNPTVFPTTNTTYFVSANDGNCIATNSVVVIVNSPFSIQASASPGSICSGETSQLSVSVSGSTATLTYLWSSNPAGFTSNVSNPVVAPLTTTVYTVLVSDGTCSVSANSTVNVNGPVSVTTTAIPQVICAGSTSQLNATATGGTTYTYAWTSDPPGFTSNLQNPVVNPTVTTVYNLTVQSTPCSASKSVTVSVNPLPQQPTIYAMGDTLFSSASTGNQWYFNSVLISGANSNIYIPQQNGSYQVQVTDGNGCISLISDAYILTSTSLYEPNSNITIYPNPSNGIIHIKGIQSGWDDYTIAVYDFNGRRIIFQEFSETVDLTSFASGMVYLVISYKSQPYFSRKISIQK